MKDDINVQPDWPDRKLYKDQVYPHCDPRVLHAPGECEFCDEYASRSQADRKARRINFTGHTEPGHAQCPSDAARGVGGAHVWGGNRPVTNHVTWGLGQGITWSALRACLKNFGIDAECGACMEIFFTGMTTNAHTHK